MRNSQRLNPHSASHSGIAPDARQEGLLSAVPVINLPRPSDILFDAINWLGDGVWCLMVIYIRHFQILAMNSIE